MTNTTTGTPAQLRITVSSHFVQWLADQHASLICAAEYGNLLLSIGLQPDGRLTYSALPVNRPGALLYADDQLYVAAQRHIWRFANLLTSGERDQAHDRLFVPRTTYHTGDLDLHDLAIDRKGRLLFANTRYSCLATLSERHNFEPLWQPPFISELLPEDRCHLTGVALRDGVPRYVTLGASSDTARGWQSALHSGALYDIATRTAVIADLVAPHYPRFYQDRLWLLNTGVGTLGFYNAEARHYEAYADCPGFPRSVAFHGDYAIVGLSRPAAGQRSGLPLETQMAARGEPMQSGLLVIDMRSGLPLHWLQFSGAVHDVAAVVVLPAVRNPALRAAETPGEELISFAGGSTVVRHRLQINAPAPAGRQPAGYRFQLSRDMQVAVALRDYEHLIFPNLRKQQQARPLREPLTAMIARHSQDIVAMILAEPQPDRSARIVSFFVEHSHRRQGLGANLLAQLEKALAAQGCPFVDLVYRDEWIDAAQLERLLERAGWQPPQPRMLLCKATTASIAGAPWLNEVQLPEGFEIFDWVELSPAEREDIVQRQVAEGWFPDVLTPFQEEGRIEPLNSLGLRHGNEVVGWMITHRLDANTIQYTSLFVRPPYQGLGRAVPLLAAAIKRQCNTDIINGIFQVDIDNKAMARFVERRMRPYLVGLTTARIARKDLA